MHAPIAKISESRAQMEEIKRQLLKNIIDVVERKASHEQVTWSQNQAKESINKFEIEHKGEDCMVCAVLKAAFVGVGHPNNKPAEQKQYAR
jgi:hypothetical protein